MKTTAVILLCLINSSVLAQEFVFVFLNKKQQSTELPLEQLNVLMEGHMANIRRLAKEGKLVAAGPFDGGGGIFIFKSNSVQQVDEWLNTDPAIQAKRWDVEKFPYEPRVGSACAVAEPIEMTNYYLVRFGINITKYSIGEMSKEIRVHDLYLKKLMEVLGVIAEGSLGEQEGGILVAKTEPAKELIEKDPSIQRGAIEFEIKKLYIAKGSFCEPRL